MFGDFDKNEEIPEVQRREVTVEYKSIVNVPAPVEKMVFSGESKCGKSVSALTLGYLDKKYIDDFRDKGFKYIPYALENDIIPEIKTIYMIDSEAFLNQLGRSNERKIVGEIFKEKVKYISIPTFSKKEIATLKEVAIDPKSVDKVQFAVDMYTTAIEQAVKNSDENTLIILDSGSRLKWLLDAHAEIVYNVNKTNGVISGRPELMPMEKYGPRNIEWIRLTTMLKQSKASVIMTLMMVQTSQVVLDMKANSKHPEKWKNVGPRKREWIEKGTEYNFDSEFSFDKDLKERKFCRIKDLRGLPVNDFEKHYIDTDTPYSFLWAVEEKLGIEIGEIDD